MSKNMSQPSMTPEEMAAHDEYNRAVDAWERGRRDGSWPPAKRGPVPPPPPTMPMPMPMPRVWPESLASRAFYWLTFAAAWFVAAAAATATTAAAGLW